MPVNFLHYECSTVRKSTIYTTFEFGFAHLFLIFSLALIDVSLLAKPMFMYYAVETLLLLVVVVVVGAQKINDGIYI